MTRLTNITKKIVDDAQKEHDRIIQQAKQEGILIADTYRIKAKRTQQEMLEETINKLDLAFQSAKSSAKLQVRDQLLLYKQEKMNQLFEETKQQLEKMDEQEFLAFFLQTAQALPFENEIKVSIGANHPLHNIEESIIKINQQLTQKSLILTQIIENTSGFLFEQNGILFNFFFADLLNFYKEEMGIKVLNSLFVEEE
ncbi:MAG: V-type ATP synthase subunit E [Streptococcaceae bacterium]|jgi:V/A-type H+-transporting ATPase subunit E|nr:V-type ATP synthase subunit E [Streptococcaceae bacterium]